MPPFLAQQRLRNQTTTAAPAAAPATQLAPPPVTINMDQPTQAADGSAHSKGKVETLFGPPVGVGGTPAPEWTILAGKAELKGHGDEEEEEDELTMDVVQGWIRRSKEESAGDKPVATTTLQALVNLKRPTIKLTPLTIRPSESPQLTNAAAAHGLEFDFDCDAARCAISIRAVVPAVPAVPSTTTYPPSADTDSKNKYQTEWTTISLFDTTIDGGFGKVFKFDEHGAVLELDKLDVADAPSTPPETTVASTTPNAEGLTPPTAPAAGQLQQPNPHRRRFSAFHFRRRSMAHDAAGPALQVVDADAEAQAAAARAASDQEDDHTAVQQAAAGGSKASAAAAGTDTGEDSGAKVVIRLEALDENDKPLRSRNAQLTYLHILRMAASAPSESTPASEEPTPSHHRPWIVKVVKREAVIGSHTFRLQEIYGLASSSSTSSYSSNNNNTTITQSATPATVDHPRHHQNDAPATECVLCLSNPREVVLLPCRHLVACRECAVNMVEFGAGGQLTHDFDGTNATTSTPPGGESAGDSGASNPNENQAAAGSSATERQRRKRKAKGWFCPICRQPYTALLRITATPPGKRLSEDSSRAAPSSIHSAAGPTSPPAAHLAQTSQAADATNAPTAEEGNPNASSIAGVKLSGLLGSLSLRGKKGDVVAASGSDAV